MENRKEKLSPDMTTSPNLRLSILQPKTLSLRSCLEGHDDVGYSA